MTLQWTLAWWNLIFILPFGLALLYLILYAASGLTFGETDSEVEIDHDVDAGEASPARAALQWLGVGRVPLSILLMVLLLAWGTSGFLANQILRGSVAETYLVLASVPIALAVSLLITRILVRAIQRFVPLD